MKKQNLEKTLVKIFLNHKLNKDHSKISSRALINAELVGAYGHGLSRLKMYCNRLQKKLINPNPKIRIKKISNSISLIDADNSIGFVAADVGIKKAIQNAKKTGIGMVGIKNSGHYGLSGYYAEQAVKKNLITMIFTNAPPAVAPRTGSPGAAFHGPRACGPPSLDSPSPPTDRVRPGWARYSTATACGRRPRRARERTLRRRPGCSCNCSSASGI